jgi:hypothetical protein
VRQRSYRDGLWLLYVRKLSRYLSDSLASQACPAYKLIISVYALRLWVGLARSCAMSMHRTNAPRNFILLAASTTFTYIIQL